MHLTELPVCPQILHAFTRSGSWATLALLAVCYVPIVFTGFRAATWNSYVRNLRALTLAGSPYVVMTIALVGMYIAGTMGNLSLALSMSIGFAGVGVFSAIGLFTREHPFRAPHTSCVHGGSMHSDDSRANSPLLPSKPSASPSTSS